MTSRKEVEKPSPAFKAHKAAIEVGEITKTNVIGIRKLCNGAWRRSRGYSVGMSTPLGTLEQADELISLISKHKPKVAGELHETGLKLLQSRRYAKRWTDTQAKEIAAATGFRLVWFKEFGNNGGNFYPVYSVWAKVPPKGDVMDEGEHEAFYFYNIPWQSGGNGPVVCNKWGDYAD
jgi:hypothetical protein